MTIGGEEPVLFALTRELPNNRKKRSAPHLNKKTMQIKKKLPNPAF